MRRIICFVLAAVMTLTLLCSCGSIGSSNKVEKLIERFENACNTLDIDAMLDCITPRISNSVKTFFGIAGAFSDMENEEIFDYISEALISEEGLDGAAFFESISVKIKTITVTGEDAVVECDVSYEINNEELKREACFTCVYYTEEWYISSFSFN